MNLIHELLVTVCGLDHEEEYLSSRERWSEVDPSTKDIKFTLDINQHFKEDSEKKIGVLWRKFVTPPEILVTILDISYWTKHEVSKFLKIKFSRTKDFYTLVSFKKLASFIPKSATHSVHLSCWGQNFACYYSSFFFSVVWVVPGRVNTNNSFVLRVWLCHWLTMGRSYAPSIIWFAAYKFICFLKLTFVINSILKGNEQRMIPLCLSSNSFSFLWFDWNPAMSSSPYYTG